MQAILSQLMGHLNSSVFVLLGIFFVAALALYRLGYHLGKWQERFFTHDKRLDKVEAIHETVIELKTKVQLIYDNTNPRATVMSKSPLSLSDLGKEIAAQINAEAIFKRYLATLAGKVDSECPKGANAYDIQAASMDISKNALPAMATADETNMVKNEAFMRGILAEDVWAILGIYLRDHILADRGIAVMDVDRHDPENMVDI